MRHRQENERFLHHIPLLVENSPARKHAGSKLASLNLAPQPAANIRHTADTAVHTRKPITNGITTDTVVHFQLLVSR